MLPNHNFTYWEQSLTFHAILNEESMRLDKHKKIIYTSSAESKLASSDFCRLLITFTNSLDPDQDRQNVGPDLDSNCLTL